MNTALHEALAAKVPGTPEPTRPDRLVIVDDPDLGTVQVRWRLGTSGAMWKCGACGLMDAADCMHTFSAGTHLAADLLGLTVLNPTQETR